MEECGSFLLASRRARCRLRVSKIAACTEWRARTPAVKEEDACRARTCIRATLPRRLRGQCGIWGKRSLRGNPRKLFPHLVRGFSWIIERAKAHVLYVCFVFPPGSHNVKINEVLMMLARRDNNLSVLWLSSLYLTHRQGERKGKLFSNYIRNYEGVYIILK